MLIRLFWAWIYVSYNRKSMKILVVSDLHYRLKQFDWLTDQASNFDAMIIAGDMLDISSYLDLSVQIVVMKKCLKAISEKTLLMVCSGNHDGNEKNDADEYVAPWLQEVRDEQAAWMLDMPNLAGRHPAQISFPLCLSMEEIPKPTHMDAYKLGA